MGANFVQICLILGSAVQAGVTALSWLGITISISSISSYAYFSFTGRMLKSPFAPLPSASADGNDASDVKSLSRSSSIEMPTPQRHDVRMNRRPERSVSRRYKMSLGK